MPMVENEYVRARRRRKRASNRLNAIAVIGVMIFFIAIVSVQIISLEKVNKEKTRELNVRQEELKQEEDRTQELEQLRVYVQSKQYVEEEAKKMGYVYPNQIIFKPEDK